MSEGKMQGEGKTVRCKECGESYTLDEYGFLVYSGEGEGKFTHIPDWFSWERKCVRDEVLEGEYSVDIPVDICMTVDTKAIYHIGSGRLRHNDAGFVLESDDGELHYEQKTLASYTVNSDFNWYELGDVISIGNNDHLFYCFPKTEGDIVAKIRLAAEEIYKILKEKQEK
jgi:hypothetical protein